MRVVLFAPMQEEGLVRCASSKLSQLRETLAPVVALTPLRPVSLSSKWCVWLLKGGDRSAE